MEMLLAFYGDRAISKHGGDEIKKTQKFTEKKESF
jgi:hypothetical protein